MKWAFLAITLLCLAVLPAKAETDGPRNYNHATDPTYDAPVLACQTSADCAVFTPPCRAPVAVNTSSIGALEDWKKKSSYRFGCRVVKGAVYNNAECVQGYCALGLKPPRASASRNPKFCKSDADCRIAIDSCDRKYPVNTEYYEEKQAMLDSRGPCGSVRDSRTVRELHCSRGICQVSLGNYGD